MTEALNLSGPTNLELIHLDEARELAYWAHVLGTSEDQLKAIVAAVGPRAVNVRRYVSRMRHAEWQRKVYQSHHQAAQPHQHDARAQRSDPLLALIVCCAAIVATTFGAMRVY